MAKGTTNASQSTPQNEATAADPVASNTAAPKKSRKKGVKYTTVIESNFDKAVFDASQNPLDNVIKTRKGGLTFPGVVFETNILGSVVKIPEKATAIKAPTLRQLIKVLDDLYTK